MKSDRELLEQLVADVAVVKEELTIVKGDVKALRSLETNVSELRSAVTTGLFRSQDNKKKSVVSRSSRRLSRSGLRNLSPGLPRMKKDGPL